MSTKTLTDQQKTDLLEILQTRFEKNKHRHKDIKWSDSNLDIEVQYTIRQNGFIPL